MLTIDPTKILSTLIERGGLLIPKSVEKDLDVLRTVCRCEAAELNVLDRHLALYNATIGLPDRPVSLRIGRVYVHWDSYLQPCLQIEVDEVDIVVEFTNLVLTRNNWNELQDLGFPPALEESSSADSSIVRIHSLDLSKKATLTIRSRPLRKEIGRLSLDMDATDGWNDMIVNASDANLLRTGRRGVTSTELSTLLEAYFNTMVRRLLANVAMDAPNTVRNAAQLLDQAGGTVRDYASQATEKTSSDLESIVKGKLQKLGLGEDHLDTLKDLGTAAALDGLRATRDSAMRFWGQRRGSTVEVVETDAESDAVPEGAEAGETALRESVAALHESATTQDFYEEEIQFADW